MNYPETIGKIEDAGTLVRGGRIDEYWNQEGHRFYMKSRLGVKQFTAPHWMIDSNKVMEHFNLRSIEFGNWMNQEDRLNYLVATAYSLIELARIVGVKSHQIGLGRRLSIALGARGKGPAAGHFEPSPRFVINITKTAQVGVLAHEYAHAIDNLLSFHTGGKKQAYVSGGRTTRKGFDENIAKSGNYFEQLFEDFFNRLYFDKEGNYSRFAISIRQFDEYWNRRNEVFARTFEAWTKQRQIAIGSKNNFLVSDVDERVYPNPAEVGQVARIIEDLLKMAFKVFKEDATLAGIDGYNGLRTTIKHNASLDDTLQHMKRMALEYNYQVADLAEVLKGKSVKESARNIWNFLRENTAYKLDQDGIEELRTPARSLADGKKGLEDLSFGIDCDDYTILISALLLQMGIPHEFRIAAYASKGKFQHIYPVAFDKNGKAWVIDVVPEIPHFNFEQKPIADLKIVKMELQELSGVADDAAINDSEFTQDIMEELNEPFELSGVDDPDDDLLENHFLSGFQEVDDEQDAEIVLSGTEVNELVDRGLLAEVNKAKLMLTKEQNQPTNLSQLINVPRELDLINKLMSVWFDKDARMHFLKQAASSESAYAGFFKSIMFSLDKLDREATLSGIDDEPLLLARVSMEEFIDDDVSGLGRSRRRGRLKKFFKKIGKGVKKGLKAVVRFNPATIAMRSAILLILKTNMLKFSEKLIYGYLTESEAQAKGLDIGEYRKTKSALAKALNFFIKAGGKADKFRAAIIKGRAAKKTGLSLSGVGAAAASATAAASPFIVLLKKLLSNINPSKLVQAVKSKSRNNSNMPQSIETGMPSTDVLALPPDLKKPSFMQRAKAIAVKHKKPLLIAMIITIVAIGVTLYMKRKKGKRGLSGVRAARSYARKRKPVRARAKTTRRRRRKASSAGLPLKGSTTVIKVPTSSVKRTRVARRSNSQRLRLMHKKAKELQKSNPKTKYATLLKRASKQI